eukprot:g4252.t1
MSFGGGFGANNTGGGFGNFGKPATTTGFGNTSGGFGSKPATTGGGFGSFGQSKPASTGFGGFGATQKPAGNTGFGQTTTATTGFGGGFGATQKPAAQTGGFGTTATTGGFGSGGFGANKNPAPGVQPGFGGFGNKPAAGQGFGQPNKGFGSFGATNTGFGATNTGFGVPKTAPNFGGFGGFSKQPLPGQQQPQQFQQPGQVMPGQQALGLSMEQQKLQWQHARQQQQLQKLQLEQDIHRAFGVHGEAVSTLVRLNNEFFSPGHPDYRLKQIVACLAPQGLQVHQDATISDLEWTDMKRYLKQLDGKLRALDKKLYGRARPEPEQMHLVPLLRVGFEGLKTHIKEQDEHINNLTSIANTLQGNVNKLAALQRDNHTNVQQALKNHQRLIHRIIAVRKSIQIMRLKEERRERQAKQAASIGRNTGDVPEISLPLQDAEIKLLADLKHIQKRLSVANRFDKAGSSMRALMQNKKSASAGTVIGKLSPAELERLTTILEKTRSGLAAMQSTVEKDARDIGIMKRTIEN